MTAKTTRIAVFAGPYGGEERITVRSCRGAWRFKAPGYVAMACSSAERAAAKVERMHNFIRWEA
jgi:hypothetical protein